MVNYTATGVAMRTSPLLSCFKGAQLTNIPSCGPSGPTTLWSLDHASQDCSQPGLCRVGALSMPVPARQGGSSTEQLGSGLPIGMVKPFLEPCCTLKTSSVQFPSLLLSCTGTTLTSQSASFLYLLLFPSLACLIPC